MKYEQDMVAAMDAAAEQARYYLASKPDHPSAGPISREIKNAVYERARKQSGDEDGTIRAVSVIDNATSIGEAFARLSVPSNLTYENIENSVLYMLDDELKKAGATNYDLNATFRDFGKQELQKARGGNNLAAERLTSMGVDPKRLGIKQEGQPWAESLGPRDGWTAKR